MHHRPPLPTAIVLLGAILCFTAATACWEPLEPAACERTTQCFDDEVCEDGTCQWSYDRLSNNVSDHDVPVSVSIGYVKPEDAIKPDIAVCVQSATGAVIDNQRGYTECDGGYSDTWGSCYFSFSVAVAEEDFPLKILVGGSGSTLDSGGFDYGIHEFEIPSPESTGEAGNVELDYCHRSEKPTCGLPCGT